MLREHTRNSLTILGGGPVALSAALALAKYNFQITLLILENKNTGQPSDNRTSALFSGSIELLKNLDIWKACSANAEPIKAIRLIDDTNNLFKSPEISFTAEEVGLDVLGYNIPNKSLVEILSHQVEINRRIERIYIAQPPRIEIKEKEVCITLQDGSIIKAELIIAADGKNSLTRDAAGIKTKHWTYPQLALVTSFKHTKKHHGISTEFHRRAGPCTVVPMPEDRSSLVWVEKPIEAQRLVCLADTEFQCELETRLYNLLGNIQECTTRSLFQLTALKPDVFARNRVVLLGEAAHVLPPIGAQGLNLSLRDVACLADCLWEGRDHKADLGSATILSRYSLMRSSDVLSRIYGIDLLNRSFLTDSIIPHAFRSLGILALQKTSYFRKHLINVGLKPPGNIPKLMRENCGGDLTKSLLWS